MSPGTPEVIRISERLNESKIRIANLESTIEEQEVNICELTLCVERYRKENQVLEQDNSFLRKQNEDLMKKDL